MFLAFYRAMGADPSGWPAWDTFFDAAGNLTPNAAWYWRDRMKGMAIEAEQH
jgi:hypothetical protein